MEIYTNIELSIQEYIDRLPKGLESLEKPHAITGLIKYISNKHIIPNKETIYNNPDLLLESINIYLDIVYRYGSNNTYPLIEEYALFIDVSINTLYRWINNKNNIDNSIKYYKGKKSNLTRSEVLKKLQDIAKEGRLRSASVGNVGGIFLCKAIDGMTETSPIQRIESVQTTSIQSLPRFDSNTKAIDMVDE